MEFFTIGVYNTTEEEYFARLKAHNIDTFCDIRQRRGVRGAKYAFVNSMRLQAKLKELDIQYEHIKGLAPTAEIRNSQKAADLQNNELKRNRSALGEVFIREYKNKIISNFNFDNFIEKLDKIGAWRVVLFCVEEKPEACHRSIVADSLKQMNYKIHHL